MTLMSMKSRVVCTDLQMNLSININNINMCLIAANGYGYPQMQQQGQQQTPLQSTSRGMQDLLAGPSFDNTTTGRVHFCRDSDNCALIVASIESHRLMLKIYGVVTLHGEISMRTRQGR